MLPIDLKGKVAIVTGASQGIGFGVASMLAKAGCKIAGCGTSNEDHPKIDSFKSTISKTGQEVYYESLDIKSEIEIDRFVSNVMIEFGRIDILISNAGKNMFSDPEDCGLDLWDENADLNLKSHWLISKACQAELKKNKGSIIIMSSNHAFVTLPSCFPYNVTKAGLVGLVKSLALQWGPEIRVIGLAPGFIETIGGEKWFESFPDPKAKKQEIIDIHPLRKLGTVDEIGAFCAFLSSDYAGFITGTTYLIDGGRSTVMQDK